MIPRSRWLRSWVGRLTFKLLNARRALRRRRHHLVSRWQELERRLPKPETTEDPEPYQMFGTRRDEVLELLEQRGGEVLMVDETLAAGWAWESYRYVVRKR